MSYSNIDGMAAEVLFSRLLKEHTATFSRLVPSQIWSVGELIDLALECFPSKVANYLHSSNRVLADLEGQSVEDILDLFFKVDFLIEVDLGEDNPTRIAIDVTSNPTKVRGKNYEMQQNKVALSKLGIDLAIIVYWKLETFTAKDKELSYQLATRLYEDIEKVYERGHFSGSSILI
jgi:hypothetical protein